MPSEKEENTKTHVKQLQKAIDRKNRDMRKAYKGLKVVKSQRDELVLYCGAIDRQFRRIQTALEEHSAGRMSDKQFIAKVEGLVEKKTWKDIVVRKNFRWFRKGFLLADKYANEMDAIVHACENPNEFQAEQEKLIQKAFGEVDA